MNHTAKIDPTPGYAMDDDVINEVEKNESPGLFEYQSDPNCLTDTEILDDGILDSYDDLDAADVLDDQLSMIRADD
jgi:hypothetical protein